MIQRIREAERERKFEEYANREGDIVTGIIQQSDSRYTLLDLGKVEALLPQAEQVPYERPEPGARLKAYIVEVRAHRQGPADRRVSRTHPGLIKRLFELEVPEIADGVVEIKACAREPGHRTKIAVWSNDHNVDPVGACVGARGARVRMVVNELRGEKIDIVPFSEDPPDFVAKALSPAKVKEVRIHEDTGIGRGHRARLPAVPRHRQGGPERPPGRPPHRLAGRHQERDPAGRGGGRHLPGGRGESSTPRASGSRNAADGRDGVARGRGRPWSRAEEWARRCRRARRRGRRRHGARPPTPPSAAEEAVEDGHRGRRTPARPSQPRMPARPEEPRRRGARRRGAGRRAWPPPSGRASAAGGGRPGELVRVHPGARRGASSSVVRSRSGCLAVRRVRHVPGPRRSSASFAGRCGRPWRRAGSRWRRTHSSGPTAERDRIVAAGARPGAASSSTDERLNAHVARKIRVHELAKELGLTNKEALDLCDRARHRGEEPLLEHRGRPGRPRPARKARRPDPWPAAGRARAGQEAAPKKARRAGEGRRARATGCGAAVAAEAAAAPDRPPAPAPGRARAGPGRARRRPASPPRRPRPAPRAPGRARAVAAASAPAPEPEPPPVRPRRPSPARRPPRRRGAGAGARALARAATRPPRSTHGEHRITPPPAPWRPSAPARHRAPGGRPRAPARRRRRRPPAPPAGAPRRPAAPGQAPGGRPVAAPARPARSRQRQAHPAAARPRPCR